LFLIDIHGILGFSDPGNNTVNCNRFCSSGETGKPFNHALLFPRSTLAQSDDTSWQGSRYGSNNTFL